MACMFLAIKVGQNPARTSVPSAMSASKLEKTVANLEKRLKQEKSTTCPVCETGRQELHGQIKEELQRQVAQCLGMAAAQKVILLIQTLSS